MLLSMIKITPSPGKRQEVIDILLSVMGPTLAVSGCLECRIFEECDEERAVFYLERWQAWGQMITHIRSPLYARILKSLELANTQPEVGFYQISSRHGIELIESMRSSMITIEH